MFHELQVLSTLRPSPDAFQQRVALTACTGETSVFEWRLRWQPDEEREEEEEQQQGQAEGQQPAAAGAAGAAEQLDEPAGSASSSSAARNITAGSDGGSASASDGGGRWVLESVARDASSDLPLPTTPHPK